MTPHHRFLLTEVLSHIDYLDEAISRVSQELSQRLEADEDAVVLLDSIPGVSRRTAEIMPAEARWMSAAFLALSIWPPGLGCVPEITRVLASA